MGACKAPQLLQSSSTWKALKLVGTSSTCGLELRSLSRKHIIFRHWQRPTLYPLLSTWESALLDFCELDFRFTWLEASSNLTHLDLCKVHQWSCNILARSGWPESPNTLPGASCFFSGFSSWQGRGAKRSRVLPTQDMHWQKVPSWMPSWNLLDLWHFVLLLLFTRHQAAPKDDARCSQGVERVAWRGRDWDHGQVHRAAGRSQGAGPTGHCEVLQIQRVDMAWHFMDDLKTNENYIWTPQWHVMAWHHLDIIFITSLHHASIIVYTVTFYNYDVQNWRTPVEQVSL